MNFDKEYERFALDELRLMEEYLASRRFWLLNTPMTNENAPEKMGRMFIFGAVSSSVWRIQRRLTEGAAGGD